MQQVNPQKENTYQNVLLRCASFFSFFFLIWILFAMRFGYEYAATDQDEMLPYLRNLIDPQLYPQDVFVQYLAQHVNVRTFFVWLLRFLCFVLPESWAIGFGYAIVFTVLAYFVFRLSVIFTRSNFVGYWTVLVSLVLTHKLTFGANDLIYNELLPESVAWVFVLWSMCQFLEKKYAKSGLLLGIGALFHLVTGLTSALVMGMVLLWQWLRTRKGQDGNNVSFLNIVYFAVLFLAFSAPLWIPLLMQQLGTQIAETTPSRFYLLSALRLPHHHLFFSFPANRSFPFLGMLITSIVSYIWIQKRGTQDKTHLIQHSTFLAPFVIIICVVWLFVIVFTEFIPVLIVAKLQFFKLAVLIKLFAVMVIGYAVERRFCIMKERHNEQMLKMRVRFNFMFTKTFWQYLLNGSAVVGLAIIMLQIQGQDGFLYRKIYPLLHEKSDLGKMEMWIEKNTPVQSLFVIEPSNTTFRSHAKRSIVVNWLHFPFEDAQMLVWYNRLQDVAPFERPKRGVGMMSKLDNAFYQYLPKQSKILHDKYRIDYILVSQSRVDRSIYTQNRNRKIKQIGNWVLIQIS